MKVKLGEELAMHSNINAFAASNPELYCRYWHGLTNLYEMKRSGARDGKPYVIWLAGPTGCGKTRWVVDLFPDGEVWISSDLPWCDGYNGQKVAVLDDLRKGDIKFNKLLRMLDRYKFDVPIKGGEVHWTPQIIVVTCPRTPEGEFTYQDRYNDG